MQKRLLLCMKHIGLLLFAFLLCLFSTATGEEGIPSVQREEIQLVLSLPKDHLRNDCVLLPDGRFVISYAEISGESFIYGELTNEHAECFDGSGQSQWAITLDTDHVMYESVLVRYPDHILWFSQFGDELPTGLTRTISLSGKTGKEKTFKRASEQDVYSPVSVYPYVIESYHSGSYYETPKFKIHNSETGSKATLTLNNEWASFFTAGEELLLYVTDNSYPPQEGFRPRILLYSQKLRKLCEKAVPEDVPGDAAIVSVTKMPDGYQILFETDSIPGAGRKSTYLSYTLSPETEEFSDRLFSCTVPDIQCSLQIFIPCRGGYLTYLPGTWQNQCYQSMTLCHLSDKGVLTPLENLGAMKSIRLLTQTDSGFSLLTENGEGNLFLQKYTYIPQ